MQAGTSLHVLQELSGWESVEMVPRYAHLPSEHLAEYVDRLSAIRAIDHPIGYDLLRQIKKARNENATSL